MGKPRKSRASKRRSAARLQDEIVRKASGPQSHERLAVNDSDASSASSAGVADYMENVYGLTDAGEEANEVGLLELSAVSALPDLTYLGLASGDEDCFSDDSGSDAEGGEWYHVESCELVEDDVGRLRNGFREIADRIQGGKDGGFVTVGSWRMCLAVCEFVSRMGLQGMFCVEDCRPGIKIFRGNGDIFGYQEDWVEAAVDVEDEFLGNKIPLAVLVLGCEEQVARDVLEDIVSALIAVEGVELPVLQASSRLDALVRRLGGVLGCKVVDGEGGVASSLSVQPDFALADRSILSGLAETLLRCAFWQDSSVNGGGTSCCKPLPPAVGTAEASVRTTVGRMLSTWAEAKAARQWNWTESRSYLFPSLGWAALIGSVFESPASGMSCVCDGSRMVAVFCELEEDKLVSLRARLDDAIPQFGITECEPRPQTRVGKRRLSDGPLSAAALSDRKRTSFRAREKGRNRVRAEFRDVVTEFTDWLEENVEASTRADTESESGPVVDFLRIEAHRPHFCEALTEICRTTGVACNVTKTGPRKARSASAILVCGELLFGGSEVPPTSEIVELALNIYDKRASPKGTKKGARGVKNDKAGAKAGAKSTAAAQKKMLSAPPLDESNRGFRLLGLLGHEAGTGLGADGSGRTEPLLPTFNSGRRGIGG